MPEVAPDGLLVQPEMTGNAPDWPSRRRQLNDEVLSLHVEHVGRDGIGYARMGHSDAVFPFSGGGDFETAHFDPRCSLLGDRWQTDPRN